MPQDLCITGFGISRLLRSYPRCVNVLSTQRNARSNAQLLVHRSAGKINFRDVYLSCHTSVLYIMFDFHCKLAREQATSALQGCCWSSDELA